MSSRQDESTNPLLHNREEWAIRKTVEVESTDPTTDAKKELHWVPKLPRWRLHDTFQETAFDPVHFAEELDKGLTQRAPTVLYLAYGSNLSAETFKGRRGIKPLGAQNVVVPELMLTFDLTGIPYLEPCFANVRYRQSRPSSPLDEKENPIRGETERRLLPWYENPKWKKGLVGVVYEVSLEDYATIIATEGGGASYKDVVVTCYTLPQNNEVPDDPDEMLGFKAHTLYSPASGSLDRDSMPLLAQGRTARPDPDYAQPSARYLKLLTDGAAEHELPVDYQAYLKALKPYRATTTRQRYAVAIFLKVIRPFVFLIFGLQSMFADSRGRSPKWVANITTVIFTVLWKSYDYFWKPVFGDGERTIGE